MGSHSGNAAKSQFSDNKPTRWITRERPQTIYGNVR